MLAEGDFFLATIALLPAIIGEGGGNHWSARGFPGEKGGRGERGSPRRRQSGPGKKDGPIFPFQTFLGTLRKKSFVRLQRSVGCLWDNTATAVIMPPQSNRTLVLLVLALVLICLSEPSLARRQVLIFFAGVLSSFFFPRGIS